MKAACCDFVDFTNLSRSMKLSFTVATVAAAVAPVFKPVSSGDSRLRVTLLAISSVVCEDNRSKTVSHLVAASPYVPSGPSRSLGAPGPLAGNPILVGAS